MEELSCPTPPRGHAYLVALLSRQTSRSLALRCRLAPGEQQDCVESIALGEHPEFVTADRIHSGKVEHPSLVGHDEFPQTAALTEPSRVV